MTLILALLAVSRQSARSWVQGGPTGTDRAPQGWYPGPSPPPLPVLPCSARPQNPPTPATLWLPGPASLVLGPPRARWLGGYYPCPTHPAPRTGQLDHLTGTRGDTADSRFWDTVGEPRGVEYTAVSGSWTGYIQLFED